MKRFVLLLILLPSISSLAQQIEIPAKTSIAVGEPNSSSVSASAWSVVGKWNCVHPEWRKPMIISADGTFSVGDRNSGNWKLEGERDQIKLALNWTRWRSQTLTLTAPGEFRGPVTSGEMVMRREPVPAFTESVPPSAPTGIPTADIDPAGKWAWRNNSTVNTVNADGTMGKNHDKGTWHWTDQTDRKLQIEWDNGYVDKLILSTDGKTMNCFNNLDDQFTVRRLVKPE